MVQRVGGIRRKTRHKLQKSIRKKGKLSLKRYLQEFKIGQKVTLHAEPSYQRGIFYTRYSGKVGTVKGKQGKCYLVEIKDGRTNKTLLVHPVHLKGM